MEGPDFHQRCQGSQENSFPPKNKIDQSEASIWSTNQRPVHYVNQSYYSTLLLVMIDNAQSLARFTYCLEIRDLVYEDINKSFEKNLLK